MDSMNEFGTKPTFLLQIEVCQRSTSQQRLSLQCPLTHLTCAAEGRSIRFGSTHWYAEFWQVTSSQHSRTVQSELLHWMEAKSGVACQPAGHNDASQYGFVMQHFVTEQEPRSQIGAGLRVGTPAMLLHGKPSIFVIS